MPKRHVVQESAIDTQELLGLGPAALPVLPMIYVAWADGILRESEIAAISSKVREQTWLDERTRQAVCGLLDPASPPSPRRLRAIRTAIQRLARDLPRTQRRSLAELGVELARSGGGGAAGDWASPEARHALDEIEHALGVIGTEAGRELLTEEIAAPAVAPAEVEPAFDIAAMTQLLDGEHHDIRKRVRLLLREPIFRYQYELDRTAYREQVLSWCRVLADRGLGATAFPKEYGGQDDLGSFIATFETLAFFDLSLVVKFGVQFGLFGGSIHRLGTQRHHEKYLTAVGTLELPGCFAMTETGHGSNVREVETVARFDRETDEFVIHTPSDSARKDYIGNAAEHGRLATVFAQLEIDEERYGVHAFVVPIRHEDGTVCDGVRIEDCGHKLGLNGLDNGRIWFDHVRIPRDDLLNRFGDVSADGEYSSPIPGAAKRFFSMLGTLVGGRVSVAGAAPSAAKSGLTVAIRYAATRRQFGPGGEPEQVILDYLIHQRRLMPRLATTYALDFALKYLSRRFIHRTAEDEREVEALAAGLKAYSTWQTVETLQICRECCGGQGYLSVNRFAALKADTDVFTTFEGDNTVLMQLVAKGLLTEYKQRFDEMQFAGVVKYLAGRAATALSELNPVVTRLTDEKHLRDPEFQLAAMRYREERLRVSVAQRLKRRIDDGTDSFTALNECQDHLVTLANAHVERVTLEQFVAAVDGCGDVALATQFKTLCELYALSRIEADRGWFLESGYVSGGKSKAIRALVNQLCGEVRLQAVPLVNAFGIPDEILGAPIGSEQSTIADGR